MSKKRPCRICRRWFQPHIRAGNRQKVCSKPRCQRERHRRSNLAWRAKNPGYDEKRRLRLAAQLPEEGSLIAPESDPLDEIRWDAVEQAIGPKPRAALEGIGRLLVRQKQDGVPPITEVIPTESPQQLNTCSQDVVTCIPSFETELSVEVLHFPRKTQLEITGPSP